MCAVLCSVLPDSFETPRTVAHQVSLSMRFSRQEYWSELPFPPPEELTNPGTEPMSPSLSHWQVGSLPLSQWGSPKKQQKNQKKKKKKKSNKKLRQKTKAECRLARLPVTWWGGGASAPSQEIRSFYPLGLSFLICKLEIMFT